MTEKTSTQTKATSTATANSTTTTKALSPKMSASNIPAENSASNVSPVTEESQPKNLVFVGNLSYQTRESELREIFEKFCTVSDVKIVFRGARSLGYGFVTFDDEKEMEKALTALKDHEFDGRKLNVERAVPKEERPERSAPRRGGFRTRGTGYRGGSYRRGSGASSRGRRPRVPRQDQVPSNVTVFVGNLPFKAVDQDLYIIFKQFGVAKAHVVRRSNGASRGYGFVTFTTEEGQARALSEMADVECDERPLIVRAALSEENTPGNDDEAEAGEQVSA